jgi:hypothetical protein
MKTVRVGNGREYLVPTTWAEGEEMITKAMRYHEGRGANLATQALCAQIAFGMFGEEMTAPDPTTALAYLIQRICQRKGAGLYAKSD